VFVKSFSKATLLKMVASADIIASNMSIASTFPNGLVAIFVGGTSGVGEYTVKTFAKYTKNSRIYLVGRSQESADRIIEECKRLSPTSTFKFIQSDISLMKNVDDVCQQIQAQEPRINVLFLSQGSMAFSKKTSEGLPLATALAIYSRLRFILNLLPTIQKATTLKRIVSVGAATCEGNIDVNNILGENLPLKQWRNQTASVHTLLLEEASSQAQDVSFIHNVPGVVPSGITRDAEGVKMAVLIGVSKLLGPLINTAPDECGEQQVFLATSARYVARQEGTGVVGVAWRVTDKLARGSNGELGSGVYTVDNKGESASVEVEKLLAGFRKDGTAKKVRDHIVSDLERIKGT